MLADEYNGPITNKDLLTLIERLQENIYDTDDYINWMGEDTWTDGKIYKCLEVLQNVVSWIEKFQITVDQGKGTGKPYDIITDTTNATATYNMSNQAPPIIYDQTEIYTNLMRIALIQHHATSGDGGQARGGIMENISVTVKEENGITIKDQLSTAFTLHMDTIQRALAFADAYPEIDLSAQINESIIDIINLAIDSQATPEPVNNGGARLLNRNETTSLDPMQGYFDRMLAQGEQEHLTMLRNIPHIAGVDIASYKEHCVSCGYGSRETMNTIFSESQARTTTNDTPSLAEIKQALDFHCTPPLQLKPGEEHDWSIVKRHIESQTDGC